MRVYYNDRCPVCDAGNVHVGADAFVALWRATPGQRRLGRPVGLPIVRSAAHALYDWFADRLHAWNRREGRW
jgi:predicted DCC family thiol-disulfide oxidoreductase YuxK